MKKIKIEISSKTIIFTIFFLLFLGFLWQIKELIFSLFIAFIISGALKPIINYLETKKLPRTLAVFFIYFGFISLIIYLFLLVLPPLIKEISLLLKNLPLLTKQLFPGITTIIDINNFSSSFPNLANDIFSLIKNLFSNLLFVISTLFFGFYLTLDKDFIKNTLKKFLEDNQAEKISYIISKAETRASSWFWGEIILMIVVGFLTYTGLLLIGMEKYALALAVLAGFLEIVPNIGPILSTIPATIIGLSYSFYLGLYNLGLYILIQQLENNLIVPLIMKKIIGLHPITTLMALIIGGKLAGVLGILLSVPITIFIETILVEWQKTNLK